MTLVNHKYKLGALVRGGEVSTFEAEDLLSGRPYYVHLLSGVGPTNVALQQSVHQWLASGQGGPQGAVVEQGDYEGKPYVVTLAKAELLDLKHWLDTQGPAAATGSGSQPGVFTLLFQSGSSDSKTAQTVTDYQPPAANRPGSTQAWSSPQEPPSPPRPAPAAPPSPPDRSGEFTRVFGGSSPSPSSDDVFAPPAAAPTPPSPLPPPRMESAPLAPRNPTPPPSSGGSGGFTQLFGEPGKPSSPPPASQPSSPGSTGVFAWPPAADPVAPSAPTPDPVAPPAPAPPAGNTGEFTRLFESGRPGAKPGPSGASSGSHPRLDSAGSIPPPPPDATKSGAYPQDTTSSGLRKISPEERREEMRQFRMISREGTSADFTKTRPGPAFGADAKNPPAPSPPVHQPPPPPPSTPPQQQTGEFTRLFRSGSPSASGQHPAPSAPAAPPPPPKAPSADAWGQEPNLVQQTGEFTKLFRGPQGSPPAPSSPASQPPPTAPASSSGDFTRQFGSGFGGSGSSDPWSQPSAPVPPPQQNRPSGDFTRIFGGGAPGSGIPARDPADDLFSSGTKWPAESSQPLTEPDQQGDFTKLFGKGGRAGNDWTGPQYAAPSGATQISREPPMSHQVPPPASAPPPPSAAGPGEFTRIMGGQAPPSLPRQQFGAPPAGQAVPPAAPPPYQAPGYAPMQQPPAAAPPAAQAQPAAKQQAAPERVENTNRSMYLILALVFCGLLVAALAIVLFVVLTRPAETTAPAGAPGTVQQAPSPVGSSGAFARPSIPGVSTPSVSAPSVSTPSFTPPSASASGVSAGSVTAPSVTAPSVSTPSLPSARLPTGVQAPAVGPAAAPQSSGLFLALIVVLSVLLVAAIGAAVFFALRR